MSVTRESTRLDQLVIDALLGVEANLNSQGWDEPIGVFVLYTNPFIPEDATLSALMMDTIDVTPWMSQPRPYRILDALAARISPLPDELAPFIHAVGFHGEGWELHTDDPAEWEEYLRVADERAVHQHPQRVEVRKVDAIGRDGRAYCVLRRRGEPPEVLTGLDDPHEVEGELVNSLRRYAVSVFGPSANGADT